MEYEEMLESGLKKLPKSLHSKERFEIPKVSGHIQGNKTIINNFSEIVKTLNRQPEHLLKFLQRELATPATIENKRLIFARKLSSSLINQKIELYTRIFVICPECGKPDTQMMKENKVLRLKCLACGAKHTIKAKI